MLKTLLVVILLLIVIPGISIGSILAYNFLTKTPDNLAANTSNLNTASNANNAATATPTPAPATPAPTATPAIQNPPLPNPVASRTFPFVGRWEMTGNVKNIYTFSPPKKVGNSDVGLMRVKAPEGKESDSNYTVLDSSSNRFEVNGSEYKLELSNQGQTLKLETDSAVMYFVRLR